MKYRCLIYNHDHTFTPETGRTLGSAEPALVGVVTVKARSPRQAAARAYVRRVGRRRARLFQELFSGPSNPEAARQADPRAVAREMRKVTLGVGDCWQLDNALDAWFIRAEPCPAASRLSRPAPARHLLRQLHFPPPN